MKGKSSLSGSGSPAHNGLTQPLGIIAGHLVTANLQYRTITDEAYHE